MAAKTQDERTVTVKTTRAELSTFLGRVARDAGLIDFDPDTVSVFDQGDSGFEIVFTISTPQGVV